MRVTSHTYLTIATIILAFAFTCYGASVSEPNKPSAEKASPREVSAHAQKDSDAIRVAKAELRAEMYKDSADSLKWALGIIIGLVIIFVGYAVFKDTRDYKQAVTDAKQALSQAREASKEARDASDKARDYEEKAREKLASIDEKVETKLKQIEQEAKKQRQVSREEAEERQSTFSLLTESARAYNDKKYELAVGYLKQILKIDPQNADALSNWGAVLIGQAKTKKGKAKRQLLNEAREKCLKTESIKPGEGAYNLACVHALLGEEKECQKWLKIVEQGGTLTNRLITREKAMADPDLKSVRDKAWFKQIWWKGE